MKQLATVPLPESDIDTTEGQQLAARLAEASALRGDQTKVDLLSTESPDLSINGVLRPPLLPKRTPTLLADELEELSNSSKDTLPLFRQGSDYSQAGFYEIESASVEPSHPTQRGVYQIDLSLTRAGTRGSSYRAIATNPRDVEHPFGTDATEIIGIPATARKVQWYDPGTNERVPASPASTVATVHLDVDQYDLQDGRAALSTTPDNPTLLYDLSYANDVQGVRAYDTLGNTEKTDLDGVRQWQVIHQTGHDVAAPIVLDDGQLRIRVTEPDTDSTGDLTVERWDDTAGEYQAVDLPATDYQPLDLDVVDIGQQSLVAQILFVDETQSPAATISLNVSLAVGREDALVYLPADSDGETVPQELQDHLGPIAAATTRDSQPRRTLVPRSEVRD